MTDASPVPSDSDVLGLLRLETATLCEVTELGRTTIGRSPERKAPPRMSLVRSPAGSLVWLRHDVDDEAAREVEALASAEPWPDDPSSLPIHLSAFGRILGVSVDDVDRGGPIYTFPDRPTFAHPARLIRSGTGDADRLVARLVEHGMPESLSSAGFVDVGELWEPWCIAADGEEIASIAFTVGSTASSAEVGVCSMVAFRGRGFAAAAVAGWASHPELRGRTLFYSTSWSNVSSQRVTDRLGLRFLGTRFTID